MGNTVVVGVGPNVGFAIARAFGREGDLIGLVARSESRLEHFVRELKAEGIKAFAFPADASDPAQLTDALECAGEILGPITTLEYSPMGPFTSTLETTPESALDAFRRHTLGAITAVRAVAPAMEKAGDGTLLFTTGASAQLPVPMLGSVGIAQAALRSHLLCLHHEFAPKGIFVGNVCIHGQVSPDAGFSPDEIADLHLAMRRDRDKPERVIGQLPPGISV
ncbi:MAG: SDR family NAD(P)-dependent oxidoreductase [Streptosporangiaceae bacterium]|nr:SDR family NAD(P)-dependent oxidoreductase [Streptosporangiaceae bacterium]